MIYLVVVEIDIWTLTPGTLCQVLSIFEVDPDLSSIY
jgi:hypothetical protein